jgi:hypothetical protein
MDRESKKALATIRRCLDRRRYRVLQHFTRRMDKRGLFWPEVLAVIESPASVRDGGLDRHDRPKWMISGAAADGLQIEVVCVIDVDEQGEAAVFITLYWED